MHEDATELVSISEAIIAALLKHTEVHKNQAYVYSDLKKQ